MWLGSNRGLKMMDLKTGAITKYEHDPADSNSIDNNNINSIATDKNENLWVGTSYGLNRLDNQTGHFKKYLGKHYVFWITVDSEGNIWVATATGLFRYDQNDRYFFII